MLVLGERNFDGRVFVNDGSAAEPPLAFFSDQDSGIRPDGSGGFSIVVGGADRWVVDSTGALIAQGGTSFISNVTDPVLNQDAATKLYVDNAVAGVASTLQDAYDGSTQPQIVLDTPGGLQVRDNATPLGTDLFEVQDNAGVDFFSVSASAVSSSVPVLAPDGTAGAPAIAWASEPTNGLYRRSTNQVAVATNGVSRWFWNASGDYIADGNFRARAGAGSAAIPSWSFEGDPDTGLFRGGANVLGVSTGTVHQWNFQADGVLAGVGANVSGISLGGTASALVSLASTTQGFGLMAMTEAERDLIVAPATGLLIFNTDANQVNQYNGSAWTVPGGGLTTLQGAYDNDPTGAQIVLDATPNPFTVQASVAGTVVEWRDVGGNPILNISADPDTITAEASITVNDPFLNAGAANSIVMSDTFTTGGGFVGGGILSNGTVTYNNAVFIWALLQESKVYRAAVGPGFAAFTLFNALARIENSGNFDLVQALTLNVGVTHARVTSGTSAVIQNNAVNFAPRMDTTVSGAVLTRTNANGMTVAPVFSTVAGSTVNLGTIRGIQFNEPGVALFGSSAGIENLTAYYGLDFPNMTFGGASATYSVVRSQLNSGTNKRFLDHTGNAVSRMRGHLLFDVDNFGVIMGAGSDVLLRWGSVSNAFDIYFNNTLDNLQLSTPAADRFLFDSNGGNTVSEFNFNCHKFSLGAQTGAVGNQIGAFVAGADTVTVAGEYSQFLLTQAGNLTIDANVDAFGWTINAPSFTAGTGTLTTAAALNVGGNPGLATTNRVGVRIISNPSGGSGVNAALWVTAGRSRFDGVVDINAPIALGGGATATLGTIGGSGPTAAAQAQWIQIEVNGVNHWIPAWT